MKENFLVKKLKGILSMDQKTDKLQTREQTKILAGFLLEIINRRQ